MADEIKDSYTRQRRNLLIMLGAIFLTYFWDLQFTTINLIGNQAVLGNTRNVYPVMWILLIYWYWRYESLLHDMGGVGIKEAFFNKRHELFKAWSRKSKNLNKLFDHAKEQHELSDVISDKMSFDGPYLEEDSLFVCKYEMRSSFKRKDMPDTTKSFDVVMRAPYILSFLFTIRTVVYLIVKTRLFSEYLLPRVLFWAFLVYWFMVRGLHLLLK